MGTPIFLPIMNYAPTDDTLTKSLVAKSIENRRDRIVFLWRAWFIWFKLLMIHLFMAIFLVYVSLDALLITYFARNNITAAVNVNSWTFLVNACFQAIGLCSFIGITFLSINFL